MDTWQASRNQKLRWACVVSGVTPKARRMLAVYYWPGYVRELQNAVERAHVLGSSKLIQPEDLPAELQPKIPTVLPIAA